MIDGAGDPASDEAGVDAPDLIDDEAVVTDEEVDDASELRVRFPKTMVVS